VKKKFKSEPDPNLKAIKIIFYCLAKDTHLLFPALVCLKITKYIDTENFTIDQHKLNILGGQKLICHVRSSLTGCNCRLYNVWPGMCKQGIRTHDFWLLFHILITDHLVCDYAMAMQNSVVNKHLCCKLQNVNNPFYYDP